ncbi:hypothetical protein H9L39_08256 [Fusarium oxysporum f. sp. albedinis]|nr:hypothetical protein H9L39_08256 [Fusarium oxysporum f. sp. albedinis]
MAALNPATILRLEASDMSQQEPSLYFQPKADTPLEPLLVAVLANNDGVPLSKEWIKTLLDKLDGCDVYGRNLFLSGVIITTPRRGQIASRFLGIPERTWNEMARYCS